MDCTITYVFQLLWANRLAGAHKVGKQWRIPMSAIRQRMSQRSSKDTEAVAI
jgi:hypothetical protein